MADEATTSPSEKEEKTTSQEGATTHKEGTEAITSKQPTEDPNPSDNKKVVDLETRLGELEETAKQAKTLQGQADKKAKTNERENKKLKSQLKKARSLSSGEEFEEEEEESESETTDDELRVKNDIKDLILSSEDYRKVLAQDDTLKEIILKNPLALLENAYSVEDAVDQIKEKLDSKVEAIKSSETSEEDKEEKEEGEETEEKEEKKGEEFEAGAKTSPQAGDLTKANELLKDGKTDEGIEESIKSKIHFQD